MVLALGIELDAGSDADVAFEVDVVDVTQGKMGDTPWPVLDAGAPADANTGACIAVAEMSASRCGRAKVHEAVLLAIRSTGSGLLVNGDCAAQAKSCGTATRCSGTIVECGAEVAV